MTLVGAEQGPPPGSAAPQGLPHGMALSAALHVVLGGMIVFGLPTLFHPPVPQEMPIAVALVNAGPETRATTPNPYQPHHDAKPIAAEAPDNVPVPKPKPVPPKPSPTPPPSAEAPPAPPSPPPKPQPAETAMAMPMPAPSPEPKPPAPKLERPTPPLPREKPLPPPLAARTTPSHQDEKKYDSAQFRNLLKNLSTVATQTDPAARPDKPAATALHASSQPHAPLGSQLTTNEMDMVREQIERCWNVPAGARDAKDLVVEIRAVVDPDGMVRQAMIVDQGRANADPFYRAAAESARRAFYNPACRPLRLPPDKYSIWKDLVVDFSPKDLS